MTYRKAWTTQLPDDLKPYLTYKPNVNEVVCKGRRCGAIYPADYRIDIIRGHVELCKKAGLLNA